MEWISRFILYIDTYFLLSNISKLIIQWLLSGLAIYALLSILNKKVKGPNISLYVGFTIRIILLVGLSIEMLHQVNVMELTDVFSKANQPVRQFLNFMFFGYIIVVGFYYMITINDNTQKGLFYTFDIAVLTDLFSLSKFDKIEPRR